MARRTNSLTLTGPRDKRRAARRFIRKDRCVCGRTCDRQPWRTPCGTSRNGARNIGRSAIASWPNRGRTTPACLAASRSKCGTTSGRRYRSDTRRRRESPDAPYCRRKADWTVLKRELEQRRWRRKRLATPEPKARHKSAFAPSASFDLRTPLLVGKRYFGTWRSQRATP